MRAGDRTILDTNILLSASDESRPDHAGALAAVNEWSRRGVTLYTSGQILREYLVVATRPAAQNGLEMDVRDAIDNVRILRARLDYLTEDAKVAHRLTELVTATGSSGKQIHDANVVATALVHGVGAVTTLNTADFERFANHIRVTGLDG